MSRLNTWSCRALFAAGLTMLMISFFLLLNNELESERAGRAADLAIRSFSEGFPVGVPADASVPDGIAGVLYIPSLGLRLPVLDRMSDEGLKTAPCVYYGDGATLVIGGHNYRSHFGRLSRLGEGDDVMLTTRDGDNLVYTVAGAELLREDQCAEMISGGWDLTLFTCTMSRRQRITVRCVSTDMSYY